MDIKAPLAQVRAACRALRRRIKLAPIGREMSYGTAFDCAVMGGFVLVVALVVTLTGQLRAPGSWVLFIMGAGTVALAPVLWLINRAARYRGDAAAKLALVEHVIDEFEEDIDPVQPMSLTLDLGPDWDSFMPDRREANFEHNDNRWLLLAYTRRNGAHVFMRVRTSTRRSVVSDDEAEQVQYQYERLRIGAVLPGDDLMGASAAPPTRLEVQEGLTRHDRDVQTRGVVWEFDTNEAKAVKRGGQWEETRSAVFVDGPLVVRQMRACAASVAAIRTFSRPVPETPAGQPPVAERRAGFLGKALAGFREWFGERFRGRRAWEVEGEEQLAQIVAAITSDMHSDFHARDAGMSASDTEWLIPQAVGSCFRWRLHDEQKARRGAVLVVPGRPRFTELVEPSIRAVVPALPETVDRHVPVLAWAAAENPFPPVLNIRCVPVCTSAGEWIGVDGPILKKLGSEAEPIGKVPDNFDVGRCAAMALDTRRDVLALWQRAWALEPSRTFFYDKRAQTWSEHIHSFLNEDENAAVSFLFDYKRDAFVRIGVTYNAVWSDERECHQTRAGVVQLALGSDGRVAVSDAASGQTLVVDVEHDRVFRVAPEGWSLVASIAPHPGFEPHRAVWSLDAGAMRYDAHAKAVVCSRGDAGDRDHVLGLAPAFAAAAGLDGAD